MNSQIFALKSKLDAGQILAKDKDFATSLLKQFQTKGDLSPKQWPWVEKLAAPVITGTSVNGGTITGTGITVTAVAAPRRAAPGATYAFNHAVPADHKQPSVILAVGENRPEGTLRLTRKQGYSNIKVQFRNSKTGQWQYVASLKPTDEVVVYNGLKWVAPSLTAEKIVVTLENFAEDVPGTLMATGKLFGICANCGKTLTHPVSIAMGIGPVCVCLFKGLAETYASKMALYNAGKDFA